MDIQSTPPGAPIPIDAAPPTPLRRAQRREGGAGSVSESDRPRDSVTVSAEGRRLARVAAAPDERTALVGRLKAAVDAGVYQIDQDAVAEALLEHGDA